VVAADPELGQCDEWFGAVEPERDAGEEPDDGVGAFDSGVGQPGVQGVGDVVPEAA